VYARLVATKPSRNRFLFGGVLLGGAAFAFATIYFAMRNEHRSPQTGAFHVQIVAPADSLAGQTALATGGDPARAAQLIEQAQQYRKAEQWDRAIDALEQAIRLGTYDEALHYTLGNWMEAHASPASMVSYWSAEVNSDLKPQTAYYYWADGLARAGDDAGALTKLGQALEIDPAHELSELGMAQILDRQGKHSEALTHCLTATRIFPDFRSAHEFCAKVLWALGRSSDAARENALALSSDPNTPRRFVYWARYLAEKGRTPAAIAELQRALAQDPNDSEARLLLNQLSSSTASTTSAR